jgi:hypothetical protein
MMALHIDNIIVVKDTHATTPVFGTEEGEEHVVCEDLFQLSAPCPISFSRATRLPE